MSQCDHADGQEINQDTCHLPVEISEDEVLLRVVKSPYHFKGNGDLHHKIFIPAPGKKDVSLIRKKLGDDECLQCARKIAAASDPAAYKGFVGVTKMSISDVKSECYDDRDGQFCGHAHLNHGIQMPAKGGEPLNSKLREDLDLKCKEILRKKVMFFEDSLVEDTSG